MRGALAWLVWTTTRNRLASQGRRLRNPRYAAAFAVGALYFWWFLFRPTTSPLRTSNPLLGSTSAALSPLLVVLLLSGVWVFGGDRTALAFAPAEVSMLFTAPLTRRALIVYKLVRAQLAILVTSVIWVFLLRRGNAALPGVLSALGFWVLFTTLACHRLGAALARASSQEHGAAGLRRHGVAIAVFGAFAFVLLVQLAGARTALASARDAGETLKALATAFSTGPARAALYPFRMMLAPVYAQSTVEWARAMLPALVVLAFHAWWVLQSDTAFEEAAADASALREKQLEKLRSRRGAVPTIKASSGARTFALASTGRPAIAIVWKNVLCLLRTSQFRQLLGPVMIALIASFVWSGRVGDPARNVALIAGLLALVLLLFGGRSIRNDLRSDMLHLPLLKTLPLSSSELVLAEVASGAVPMAATQFVLLAIAEVALAMSRGAIHIPGQLRAALIVVALPALLALNFAMFTILNGTAVLFPGWTRLGTAGAAGVEAMGSNVIATFGTLVLLALLLLVPVAGTAVAFNLLSAHVGLATAVAGMTGALALGVECYFLLRGVGRS
ncbi:MAG TPA: putative ABC exporter domain-containing protein, partial [Gemmatimonadaceae bacterium]|nr:putative ABC exporter domain-containing protein [Gemmatimonadaceae bacterium]